MSIEIEGSLGAKREELEPVLDHCGLVGIFSPQDNALFATGLTGLLKMQTRGNDGAGVVSINANHEVVVHKGQGMIPAVFTEEVSQAWDKVRAQTFIYQVRYGTSGEFSQSNVQPFVCTHNSGDVFVVAHNGQFALENHPFEASGVSDTAIFVDQLRASPGNNWTERIMDSLRQKGGAYSLIIATEEAMYLVRDPMGVRPLVYGAQDNNGSGNIWIAASETAALEQMGVTNYHEVMPGELIRLTPTGVSSTRLTLWQKAVCVFEAVYFMDGESKVLVPRNNPEDIMDAASVSQVRRRCGEELAHEAPLSQDQVDLVIGIPGTGIDGGEAYAKALGLPYGQVIKDKNGSDNGQRTFMTADIDKILERVLNHFDFNEAGLRGKRVVLVDDSIVRGNIMTGLVRLLKEMYGVSQVHVRVLCPPIDKRCYLGINTRNNKELIAAIFDGDTGKIQRAIGADSLAYLSDRGLRRAITGNANSQGFCMGCMVGQHYPVDENGIPISDFQKTGEIYSYV